MVLNLILTTVQVKKRGKVGLLGVNASLIVFKLRISSLYVLYSHSSVSLL